MKDITEDDFEAWRAHPITEAMRRRAEMVVERADQEWSRLLETDPTPRLLADLPDIYRILQARRFAYADFAEMDYETIMETQDNDRAAA